MDSQPVNDLARVSTTLFTRVKRLLETEPPDTVLNPAWFASRNLGGSAKDLAPLDGLTCAEASRLATAVLAERARQPATALSLVWTGPETKTSVARDTAVVVRELPASARSHVLIGGYRFTQGERILKPLHDAMRDHGVTTRICMDIAGTAGVTAAAQAFFAGNWPFGDPKPKLYFDPRTVDSERTLLHAKCIVVDDRTSLVTSANFTYHGQSKNIECGVLIEDEAFARQLHGVWLSLIETGLLREARESS